MKKKDTANTLSDEVYTALKKKILDFDLVPGQLLMVQEQANIFGISRTPVREAMVRLREEDMLVEATGGKFRVSQITWSFIRDLFDARMVLEGHAIENIKNYRPEHFLEDLYQSIEALKYNVENDQVYESFVEDNHFHQIIASCSNNSIMKDLLKNLGDHQLRIRFLAVQLPGRMIHTIREHTQIYQAIKDGKYEDAVDKLHNHLNESLQELDKSRKNPMSIISNLIKE